MGLKEAYSQTRGACRRNNDVPALDGIALMNLSLAKLILFKLSEGQSVRRGMLLPRRLAPMVVIEHGDDYEAKIGE